MDKFNRWIYAAAGVLLIAALMTGNFMFIIVGFVVFLPLRRPTGLPELAEEGMKDIVYDER